jgi:hypothetical protein
VTHIEQIEILTDARQGLAALGRHHNRRTARESTQTLATKVYKTSKKYNNATRPARF